MGRESPCLHSHRSCSSWLRHWSTRRVSCESRISVFTFTSLLLVVALPLVNSPCVVLSRISVFTFTSLLLVVAPPLVNSPCVVLTVFVTCSRLSVVLFPCTSDAVCRDSNYRQAFCTHIFCPKVLRSGGRAYVSGLVNGGYVRGFLRLV